MKAAVNQLHWHV